MEPTNSRWDAVIVGAGAAGLLAAIRAAERGRRTLLLEKNTKPGVKILMSGGTRCNLTHATDRAGIVEAFGSQGKFLYSALAALSPQQVVELFEAEGVRTKVEETGKIFPESDRALDVLEALLRRLRRTDCTLALGEPLEELKPVADGFELRTPLRQIWTEKLLVTTGGQSYPGCGTTGDGYRWAADLGHTIVPPRPALVPVTIDLPWVRELQGVTIPDVELRVVEPAAPGGKDRLLTRRRGSFLFTHFGLSGPAPLDVSREISGHPEPRKLVLVCDFLPAMSETALVEWFAQQAAGGRTQATGEHLARGTAAAIDHGSVGRAELAARTESCRTEQGRSRPAGEGHQADGDSSDGDARFQEGRGHGRRHRARRSRFTHHGQQAGAESVPGRRSARPGRTHRRLQLSSCLQHRLVGWQCALGLPTVNSEL